MKRNKVNKIILVIDIILLIISIISYRYIFQVETTKRIYSDEAEKFVSENQKPVFKINQIIIYSSANAIDNSDGELKNLDISQFSDIEIFIDNKNNSKEITAENTINELFIDNIKVESNSEKGEKIFNYKNPLNCGKYAEIENWRDDGILFNVINSNEKNKDANYDENVFYTDCSNPISLGYLNKDILTNCEVNTNNASISFDGSILSDAGVSLDEIDVKISFTIHLINNYNEEFVCDVKLENILKEENTDDSVYSGYLVKIINPIDDEYSFIKIDN